MSKLWGGRFTGDLDQHFADFNASFRFDQRLFEADVTGSQAYARGLGRIGIFTEEEVQTVLTALDAILEEGRSNPTYLSAGVAAGHEDIHSFVETELVNRVGDLGKRLHTGRSRNDQVATDLRLFVRSELDEVNEILKSVQSALVDVAEEHIGVAFPGYTHLQKAQPVLFSHWVLSYFEMLDRDRERFSQIRARVNRCPLGSAALAGSNYPLDRDFLAETLAFDGITANSMDAVSDRDYVLESVGAASMVMMHLSRLSEDLILYASSEFGFLTMSDRVSTGSSIMPQKKNPDALELIRGKAGRVAGAYTTLLLMMKGTPMSYNKDFQEDKEALFDALDTLKGSLLVTRTVLESLELRPEVMNKAAACGYLNATEMADYLVRKGLPFRNAHEIVGKAVVMAIQAGKELEEMPLDHYKAMSELFAEDLYEALALPSALAGKNVPGGTAPHRVEAALQQARQRLQD
jgi:argininosuccinate lyase